MCARKIIAAPIKNVAPVKVVSWHKMFGRFSHDSENKKRQSMGTTQPKLRSGLFDQNQLAFQHKKKNITKEGDIRNNSVLLLLCRVVSSNLSLFELYWCTINQLNQFFDVLI
jgi:hypothetical protein